MLTVEEEAGRGEALTQRIDAAAERLESVLRLGVWQAAAENTGSPEGTRLPGIEGIAAMLEELRVVGEQLRAQNRALAVASRQYQELFQLAPEAYVRTDLGGIIREANQAAARLFNVRQDDLLGMPFVLFIAKRERKRFFQGLTALREKGERVRWKTGLAPSRGRWDSGATEGAPRRDVMVSATAVRDASGAITDLQWMVSEIDAIEEERRGENEEGWLGRTDELALVSRVAQELTESFNAEEAAEQLLRDVRTLIGAEGASLWLWDDRGRDELVCEALSHVGMTVRQGSLRVASSQGVVGWTAQHRESTIVNCASEDDRLFRGIDEQTGLSTRSLISVPLRARGEILGVLEVVNKVEGDFDDDDLFLVETLATSAAIAIENARLLQALKSRNEDLQAFAHTVAHDIRSSLALMVGFAEAVQDDIQLLSREELGRYLGLIQYRGHKVADIVDALLHLAEVSRGEVKREALDMGKIVVEVLDRLAPAIEARQAVVKTAQAWPVVLGQEAWVEQVWANYLSNALEHGGVRPRIELSAESEGAYARFWVQDDGPGVPPEEQERIFGPFVKGTSQDSRSGLGLSIVRRIVQKLGGDVGVENVNSGGSRFWFTLAKVGDGKGLGANGIQTFSN